MNKRVFYLLLAVSICYGLPAQERDNQIKELNDSTFIETDQDVQLFEEVSELDPQRSALLSAIFPGMGQAYNKQYWKVPIIFAGMATFGHFISYNNELYHAFRNASTQLALTGENPFTGTASSSDILARNRDNFRRNRDFLIIIGSVFYLLNIVDAHVSAHLDEFNINDDLAISIKPTSQHMIVGSQAIGASLIISF